MSCKRILSEKEKLELQRRQHRPARDSCEMLIDIYFRIIYERRTYNIQTFRRNEYSEIGVNLQTYIYSCDIRFCAAYFHEDLTFISPAKPIQTLPAIFDSVKGPLAVPTHCVFHAQKLGSRRKYLEETSEMYI